MSPGLVRGASRTLFALVLSVVLAPSAGAQAPTGRIRGRVIDAASRTPIPDAQVVVMGASVGGVANANGVFLIDNVPLGAQRVRVRKIGFTARDTTLAIVAGQEVTLDVTLREAPTALSEVVVTGTPLPQQRREIANAIETVDVAKVVANSNVSTVTEVLQSRTPGVTIMPGSGVPGTAADIRIRGSGSFSLTKPIIYIDGIRYNSSDLGNFAPTGVGLSGQAQSQQSTSALDFLNPQDIQSIEVIKGPAAATLYGADAAAGVIQIITKKGTQGQQRMQFTARADRGTSDWALDPPNNYTTCDSLKQADTTTWPGCKAVARNTVLVDNPLRRDPNALRTGIVQRLSLSARGGADRFSYFLSGDRGAEQGVFYNSFAKNQSARANFTISPSTKTDFGLNFNYIQADIRLPYQDESPNALLLSASRGRPGRISAAGPGWATIDPARSNQYNNETKSDRMTMGGTVTWRPFTWLTERANAGLDFTSSLAQLLSLPGSSDDPLGFNAERVPRTRLYTLDEATSAQFDLPWSLRSTTSAGAQVLASRTERLDATGSGLGAIDVTLIGTAITTTGANTFSENNTVGYYLQEQMAWRNRLILTGALRADDNSSFGTNYNVITYPKASLSYVLSEEPALQGLMSAIHSDEFKYRLAWGRAGRAPAPYSATQTYTPIRVTLGNSTTTGVTTSAYGNANLRSETGSEVETGFDATFFNQRLQTTFTYYDKTTMDLLFSQAVAPSLGWPGSVQRNLGKISNKGIEMNVGGTPFEGRWVSWESRLNLATNRNRLVTFGIPGKITDAISGQAYSTTQLNHVGYPLGGYWVRFPMRNRDGTPVLNATGTSIVLDTLAYVGPSLPTREAGWANTFTFLHNFRLFSLLDYKGGHYLFNGKEWNRCTSNTNCQAVNDPRVSASEKLVLRQSNAIYVERADFVKLRDLSLTYTVPAAYLSRLGGDQLTLTAAGHNLALWSGYTGIDPEVNTYANTTRIFPRADLYSAPMMRRITFTANLSF